MREPITPDTVIKGAAQLVGLWPPGYTTDPCPEIERNIGGLMTDTGTEARKKLGEELRRKQAYCP